MTHTRTYPDGYTYEWLTDLASTGVPVEPGYDGIVFVQPPRLLRVVIEGNEEDVVICSVTRGPLGRLSADAIDSDGNGVALPAIDAFGVQSHSIPPTRTPVDARAREVGRWLAERYLGSTGNHDSGDPA
jgi:hypothetical protein